MGAHAPTDSSDSGIHELQSFVSSFTQAVRVALRKTPLQRRLDRGPPNTRLQTDVALVNICLVLEL